MAEPFASVDDVADRWRPLTSAESAVAETLLDDASDMIRARWPDVDARITNGALTETSLVRVTANMVKQAMNTPAGTEGLASFSQGAGPFSVGGTFANPNGNLFFTAEVIRLLDGFYGRPRSKSAWLA